MLKTHTCPVNRKKAWINMQGIRPYSLGPKSKSYTSEPNANQTAFAYAKRNIEKLIKYLYLLTPSGIETVNISLKGIKKNPQGIYSKNFIEKVDTAMNKLDYKHPKLRSPEYTEQIDLTVREIKVAWEQLCEELDASNTYKPPF